MVNERIGCVDFKGFAIRTITQPPGRGSLDMRCSACRYRIKMGDVIVEVVRGARIHRSCVKRFMDWSYDQIPPTSFELDADEMAKHGCIEVGRAQREFDEYREGLRERYEAMR